MLTLGIETSCDDTAAAVVHSEKGMLSGVVRSQLREHAPYGGVVPEIAARSHIDAIDAVVAQALREANVGIASVDVVAATAGPGLIGGVVVGFTYGQALASAAGKAFYPVHHLEGHALAARLPQAAGTDALPFPYLLFLLSGGHCMILACESPCCYRLLGASRDDAVGEAFDKTAKILGLGYPGGPAVEKRAALGNPRAFAFPKPLEKERTADFSLSGLKTAVRQTVERYGEMTNALINDVCAAFQHTIGEMLRQKIDVACTLYAERYGAESNRLVLSGGVAANGYLRGVFLTEANARGMRFFAPPAALCTDNGAMIAWAAEEYRRAGITPADARVFSRGWHNAVRMH
ncbi:MAG: tRNA (adenosine(37)-N6)-threonylcarbamoyltransferase complex transferase subunit TsaD [Rickettsiales bacterium]